MGDVKCSFSHSGNLLDHDRNINELSENIQLLGKFISVERR